MNYKSLEDLKEDTFAWSKELRGKFDLIVGVPRSGLLVANLLSLHLNLPLADINNLHDKKFFSAGKRKSEDPFTERNNINNILIVDDSVYTGSEMERVQGLLDSQNIDKNLTYGALYTNPLKASIIDTFYEFLEMPRIFEWNLFHHPNLDEFCVDIDGVICRDPTPLENDDGELYKNFIKNVEPNFIPDKKIGWLVTTRLEKYREQTVEWLNKHGFKYGELMMLDLPSKKERQKQQPYSDFKASIFNETEATLFIESSPDQAEKIVKKTGKPVLCYSLNKLIKVDFLSSIQKSLSDGKSTADYISSTEWIQNWYSLKHRAKNKLYRLLTRFTHMFT